MGAHRHGEALQVGLQRKELEDVRVGDSGHVPLAAVGIAGSGEARDRRGEAAALPELVANDVAARLPASTIEQSINRRPFAQPAPAVGKPTQALATDAAFDCAQLQAQFSVDIDIAIVHVVGQWQAVAHRVRHPLHRYTSAPRRSHDEVETCWAINDRLRLPAAELPPVGGAHFAGVGQPRAAQRHPTAGDGAQAGEAAILPLTQFDSYPAAEIKR